MNVPGIIILLILSIICGCGSNSPPDLSSVSTLESSQTCINCHLSTAVSAVTGEAITETWQLSAHNTASSHNVSGRGASCGDCHEPDAGHPNSCALCHGGGGQTASVPVHNPDSARKCDKCHALTSTVHPLDRKHINPRPLHYTNYTASYLSSQFIGKCRSCHNPHNPSGHMEANREWAESGHGSYNAAAWNASDFKIRGTARPATPANSAATACVRCHTATGYINYVTNSDGRGPFMNISAWGKNGVIVSNVNRTDPTKQVLACPACHDDGNENSYSFFVRTVPAVTGYYNYSSRGVSTVFVSYTYPDIGISNSCICCHTGREIGDSLKAGASAINFANVDFISSHYFTAGATLFAQSGYSFNTYTLPFFQHDQIGINNYFGTGTRGPCVGCHMSSSTSHLFLPVTKSVDGSITGITSSVCRLCHTPQEWTADSLQAKKDGYLAALAILKEQLATRRGFYFRDSGRYAYTTTATGTTQVTKWRTDTDTSTNGRATGEKNMGAAFNLNLLLNDPGGFAHNSGYVRKLIYDSIDWIDGDPVNSVGTTINNYPVVLDPDGTVKTRAAAYLLR